MMKPVKWGIVSTAKIGVEKVIPGMMKSPDIEVAAIASRSQASAEAVAKKLGITKAYGSYEALFANPEIEAIYNPLPNHLHVPLTLEAARAGKHVLCEKPIAISAKEASELKQVAKNIHVAEAFMVRHNPQWIQVRERASKGEIGELRAVQVLFSYFNKDPRNIRNMADIGGGALYDIGCYPITVARFVFDAEPQRVLALIDRDPEFRTDRTTSGIADFGNGRQLTFTVSTQAAPYQRVNVLGTEGRLEVEIPFNAPSDQPNRYFVQGMDMMKVDTVALPVADQYQLQAEAFGRVVRGIEPLVYGIDDAIQSMRIIDAFFRSEKSGRWETP
jgi:predicted dehydrogenase